MKEHRGTSLFFNVNTIYFGFVFAFQPNLKNIISPKQMRLGSDWNVNKCRMMSHDFCIQELIIFIKLIGYTSHFLYYIHVFYNTYSLFLDRFSLKIYMWFSSHNRKIKIESYLVWVLRVKNSNFCYIDSSFEMINFSKIVMVLR